MVVFAYLNGAFLFTLKHSHMYEGISRTPSTPVSFSISMLSMVFSLFHENLKERTEMAKSMLDEDIDLVKIMKVTGLTETELLHLQDESVTI